MKRGFAGLVLALLLSALMVVPVFAGGGSEKPSGSGEMTAPTTSTGKVKISVLRPGDEQKVAAFLKPAVAKFMEKNPDIEVEPIFESWGGWIQKYTTLFAADTQPDVVFWWDNKQKDVSAKNRLVPLDKYVDASVFKAIPQSIWDLVSIGGDAHYYVPSSVDPFVLYYNKDVFRQAGLDPEKPPKTWDEFLAYAKAIKEKTGLPGVGVPAQTGVNTLQEFVAQFIDQSTGTDMLDEKNKPIFNNAKGLEAMQFLQKLWPYIQPSPTDYGRGQLRPLIRDGKLGMILEGPWAIPTLTEKFGDNLDASPIGFAPPPLGPNGQKIDWAGTNGWIATRQSTAVQSGKMISFLMSPEELYNHHVAYGSVPMLPSELDQKYYQYNYWKTFYTINTQYKLIGMIGKYHPTPNAFYDELEAVWQAFMFGQLDAKQALDLAEQKVNSINARQGIKY